jgi:hypothetical protein
VIDTLGISGRVLRIVSNDGIEVAREDGKSVIVFLFGTE